MPQTTRIPLIDLARTAALLGMVAFHFSYDLLMFGLIPYNYAYTPTFYYHARIVAGTFLLLSGLGLWLSHGAGIRWPAFWRRFAKIAGAAALVSVATRIAMPEFYVYFGILHAIALYSLLGLLALRLPAIVTAALAAVFVYGSYHWHTEALNAPLLRFVGLALDPATTMDFEPIFPWFGAVLAGIALGKLGSQTGLWARLVGKPTGKWVQIASWPGQHSLLIYLIHQPILMGLVWLYSQLA
ncbi:heparan-alpha-glucosaminide N-acetyltransferase [Cypionkella sinensis]|uniref:Heparan-alpha-glucosaminide N-acetyltransferase n=1 Tax=Cypionkella sinensis TaxID=1756043 RepID=A0ABV7IW48_9RHOB